jgi:CRP/FNR family transcriptional regulator, cyclic AMP receptor protein
MTRLQPISSRSENSLPALNLRALLSEAGQEQALRHFAKGGLIFREGEPADAVFYVEQGRVKISTVSEQGKEAILVFATSGDFIGERALIRSDASHVTTATAITDCRLLRVRAEDIWRLLREKQDFSHLLVSFLLSRNNQLQESLADQLCDHSEKRLAKILLSLAGMEQGETLKAVLPRVTHQTLAEMVGTTRPRISFFMNRFKKQRFIEYKNRELLVNQALLTFVLRD